MSIAVCRQCGEILRSKHVHDCVQCSCPNHSMLDGGSEYTRKGGVDLSLVQTCLSLSEAKRLSIGITSKLTAPITKGLNAPL